MGYAALKNCYHKFYSLSRIILRWQNWQFGHFQGAAAVGYDGGTLWRLTKSEAPSTVERLRASVQSPSSAVAKALGAILAPTLTPCTRCLYVQHLGPFTTSPPVAARLGIVGVGH